MNKIKVLVVCPDAADATSYYRIWGTIPDIEKRSNIEFTAFEKAFTLVGMKLELRHNAKTDKIEQVKIKDWGLAWTELQRFDVLWVQRAYQPEVLNLVTFAKEMGLKIIYDIDDNLWEIPQSFEVKKVYPPATLAIMDEIITQCDAVMVSTQALKQYIDNRLGVECTVINNGWDIDRYPLLPFNSQGITAWRGSSTHIADIELYRKDIERFENVTFLGYDPVTSKPHIKSKGYKYQNPVDPFVYQRLIRSMGIKLMLCPLVPDLFNECKSNIAWLEATAAGALLVGNQHGEFEGKGINFTDVDDIGHVMDEMIHLTNCQWIRDNYTLSKMNDKRIELFTFVKGYNGNI